MKYIISTISIGLHKSSILRSIINSQSNILRYNVAYESNIKIFKHINHVRQIAKSVNKNIKIMLDIPGNKPRISLSLNDKSGLRVAYREKIYIDTPKHPVHSNSKRIYVDKDQFIRSAKVNDICLVDDGLIALQVSRKDKNSLETLALNSGILFSNKGIWIQGKSLDPLISLADISKYDNLIKAVNPEWIAVSFASGDLIREVKSYLHSSFSKRQRPKIASKIESQSGIDTLFKIAKYSDMLIVARGDLAQLCEFTKLGTLQDLIINSGKKNNIPTVVATQILDSTIDRYVPSRAEIIDLHYLLISGAAGVMLSDAVVHSSNPQRPIEIVSKLMS